MKYLQSIGVQFGADLNAYTSFDETVYMLSVPTDTARLVEQAFLILEDWAHGQVFDSTEVVNERGVVQEEWRGRLGAGERMLDTAIPIILKGSKYATRIPIGTQESILGAQPSALRRFYQDWYRPDLMAVVAVGDFDVATVEGAHQAALQRRGTCGKPEARARRRPCRATPRHSSRSRRTSRPRTRASRSRSSIRATSSPLSETYRNDLIEQLYFRIINARLGEMAQKTDAPFLSAWCRAAASSAATSMRCRSTSRVKDGGVERGTEAVLVETRRVDQFGFLASELQRAKENVLRGLRACVRRACQDELVGARQRTRPQLPRAGRPSPASRPSTR